MRSAEELLGWTKLHAGMPNYISKSEVDGLNDPKNPLAKKVQIMAKRLCKLGITKPDEITFAWAVGIVVLCHFQEDYPHYKHVFAILRDMKAAHKATNTPWPFDYISDYPSHPLLLPQHILDHACDEDIDSTSRYCKRYGTRCKWSSTFRKRCQSTCCGKYE